MLQIISVMTSRKSFYLILTLSALTVCSAQAQADYDGYRLTWQEEFDYEGAPDPSVWDYEEGFVRNKEEQWYQPTNACVRDGVLTITARREKKPCPTYEPGSRDWRRQRDSITLTSACVITDGKRTFHFGRIEVRARLSGAWGSWPAIWLLGTARNVPGEAHCPWPRCGEVDIMEFYPRNNTAQLHANACWGGDKGSRWDSRTIDIAHWTAKDSLWMTRFHTWRLDWDKTAMRIYIDDELLNEIDLTKTVNGDGTGDNPFHKPMYLLLNLAMGSTGGKIDETALPVRFEVDYVRYYERLECP